MTTHPSSVCIIPTSSDSGERLDKVLVRHLPTLSRSRIQALIKDKHVRSHPTGTIATASSTVKSGESFEVTIPPLQPSSMTPNPIPLTIIYEDDDLLVVNKPAFMTVHPGLGTKEDTLVHALLAHCKGRLSGIGGVERPGIVHRLDRDTSGLMIVAKHDIAHRHLAAQLASRQLSRRYIAFVYGAIIPAFGIIRKPIARSTSNRKKMACFATRGKEAITHYQILTTYANNAVSIVSCKLETGRTHQIRVHLTDKGHGLLGDPVYGSPHRQSLKQLSPEAVNAISQLNRQALHAIELTFIHPGDEKPMTFEAPLPMDLLALEALLKEC